MASPSMGVSRQPRTVSAFFANDSFDDAFAALAGGRLDGQERHTDAVFAGWREGEAQCGAFAREVGVRNLDEDAGAIAGFGIAAARATVREVHQNLDAFDDDLVGLLALDVGDEADAASVVLKAGVVEALGCR